MTGKCALEMPQQQHANTKLPFGNHCRQVSEIKMDNPLNSLAIHCGKHVREEKGRHREPQYLVCISKSSVSYSMLFCLSLQDACNWIGCIGAGDWELPKWYFSFSDEWGSSGYSCFSSAKTSAFSQLIMERKPTGKTIASIVWAGVNHVAQETVLVYYISFM